MRQYRKWILGLGIAAAPGLTWGGPLDFGFGKGEERPAASQPSNQEMANRIATALRSAELAGSNIDITFGNGVCTLTGQVANARQKTVATGLVSGVSGVTKVDNLLLAPGEQPSTPVANHRPQPMREPVSGWPTQRRPIQDNNVQPVAFTKPASQHNSSCATGSCGQTSCGACATTASPAMHLGQVHPAAQRTQPTPPGGQVHATAPHTQPALSGNQSQQAGMPDLAALTGTQPAGHSAPARPSRPSNQQVAENIGAALRQANLADQPITIRYTGGTVTLSGSVSSRDQQQLAALVTERVPGVTDVQNNLQVRAVRQTAAFQAPGEGPGTIGPAAPPVAPIAPMNPAGDADPDAAAPGGGIPGTPGYPPGYGPGYGGAPGGYPGVPPQYGVPGPGANPAMYSNPALPPYAWPTQAQYPNSAAIQYPKQYSASAWPYIGPYYPYPQVPLGWRKASLEWDDGHWMLDFDSKTDRWWWFLNPKHW